MGGRINGLPPRSLKGYQKRFGKYGDRLFTFLSHDGVPWNNNLAENAVKLITISPEIPGRRDVRGRA